MKKFLFLLCANLLTFCALAQSHKIGEAFVKDDVPCIIIDVDESGEHGLAMSLIPTFKAMKAAKKTGEHKWLFVPHKLSGKDKKLISEYRAEYYNRTKCDTTRVRTTRISTSDRTVTSLSGKENMKNVIDYCNDKGIAMEMYFPEYYWAQNLGEGWFIPGVDELRMYIRILGYDELGFKHAQGMSKYYKNMKAASNTYANSLQELAKSDDTSCFQDAYNPTILRYVIRSSTMVNSGKKAEPLSLLPMEQRLTGKEWFDMVLESQIDSPNICAVCEF